MIEKRILLVGDGNHQFITNYAIWLMKQNDIRINIDILSFIPIDSGNAGCYNNIYLINHKKILYRIFNKVKKLRKFYDLFLYKNLFRKLPDYDIIHFHYICIYSYLLVSQFRKNTKSKIILSVWGTDMYRIKPVDEKGFVQSCLNADYITFSNEKTLDYFSTKYNWGKNNLTIARFGLMPLEYLKKLNKTKIECKEKLGWNTEKLAITIGYNLNKAQQHLEILSQFKNDKIKAFKDNIQLIIPITYGGSKNYKKQIIGKLNRLPFESTVYDTFLDDETIAFMRKATDLMIQVQKTDQFSGTMQEHLFARNLVITGSWLPYQTLKNKGAWFVEIDKVEELAEILPKLITNYTEYEQKTANSPRVISELSSWEKNIKDWICLYNQ